MTVKKGEAADPLIASVAALMDRDGLLDCRGGVIVALSGGADSVALLHVLSAIVCRKGIPLVATHLNHGLRGEDAQRDEAFVRELCTRMKIPLTVERVDVAARRAPGESVEMAARAARLAWFGAVAAKTGWRTVATGHHADDVAETLLLRLASGAGTGGLGGLRPLRVRSDGLRMIRPLLDLSRRRIREWLTERGHSWREDRTNADVRIPRNRVRTEWIPWLETHGAANLRDSLARVATILGAEDCLIDALADEAWERCRVSTASGADRVRVEALRAEPEALRRRLVLNRLRRTLGIQRPTFAMVARVLDLALRGGAPIALSSTSHAYRRGAFLCFETSAEASTPVFDHVLNVPGVTELPVIGCAVRTWMARGIVRDAGVPGRLPAAASLDPDAWAGRPLRMRNRRPGDRIRPSGFRGSRKVQDVLVDAKTPVGDRDRVPLLVSDPGDEVLWIPGYRVAESWKVRDGRRRALQVSVAPL